MTNNSAKFTTLTFAPAWGTKCNIDNRFMFEFATRLGYGFQWTDDYNYNWNTRNRYNTGKKNIGSSLILFIRLDIEFWWK
ncbi:MAG: hypothetical protein ACK5L5_07145 [Bacteroidales bacterium]